MAMLLSAKLRHRVVEVAGFVWAMDGPSRSKRTYRPVEKH